MRNKTSLFLEICRDVRDKIANAHPHNPKLAGYCWYTSKCVQTVCEKKGLKAEIKMGYFGESGHAWLEYNRVYYDLTATQFGDYPEILIAKRKSSLYKEDFSLWEVWITNSSKSSYESFLINGNLSF